MNPPPNKFPWTVVIGLLLLFMTLALVFLMASIKARLVRQRQLPALGEVADFALTNQAGGAVSLANLRGHVWVADIIFTTCPGPCLRMTHQMKELQDAIPAENTARFVSLTTFPDQDTPPVLEAYARKSAGADTNRWMFLTGAKDQIRNLATGSLKLSAEEKKPEDRTSENDLFIHSTIFVLVDKRAQLRGVYQTGGEGVDWAVEKQKILGAVKQLEREK